VEGDGDGNICRPVGSVCALMGIEREWESSHDVLEDQSLQNFMIVLKVRLIQTDVDPLEGLDDSINSVHGCCYGWESGFECLWSPLPMASA